MNARKVSRHAPARKAVPDDAPLGPRMVLDYVVYDLARIAMLAQAAAESLADLPYVADPAARKRFRRLDALVIATADLATEALADADAGVEALDADR